jgi:DNA-binding Xre family transcriptional regulator
MSDRPQSVKQEKRTSGHNQYEGPLNQHPARLKWRRVAKGLSLTGAARAAGCSKAHLSKLEHGQDSVSPELLAKFAALYECEIRDLMPDVPNGVMPKVPNGAAA